jgi:hypothetical protein
MDFGVIAVNLFLAVIAMKASDKFAPWVVYFTAISAVSMAALGLYVAFPPGLLLVTWGWAQIWRSCLLAASVGLSAIALWPTQRKSEGATALDDLFARVKTLEDAQLPKARLDKPSLEALAAISPKVMLMYHSTSASSINIAAQVAQEMTAIGLDLRVIRSDDPATTGIDIQSPLIAKTSATAMFPTLTAQIAWQRGSKLFINIGEVVAAKPNIAPAWRNLETRFRTLESKLIAKQCAALWSSAPNSSDRKWMIMCVLRNTTHDKHFLESLAMEGGALVAQSSYIAKTHATLLNVGNEFNRWIEAVVLITGQPIVEVGSTMANGVETVSGEVEDIVQLSIATCARLAAEEMRAS